MLKFTDDAAKAAYAVGQLGESQGIVANLTDERKKKLAATVGTDGQVNLVTVRQVLLDHRVELHDTLTANKATSEATDAIDVPETTSKRKGK